MNRDTLKLIRCILQLTSTGVLSYALYLSYSNDYGVLPDWAITMLRCLWGSLIIDSVIKILSLSIDTSNG